MNRSSLLTVFKPKYYSLFPFFEKNARNFIMAAEQLKLLMQTNDPEKQFEIIKRINELERIGDVIISDTNSILARLFILPFDRADINNLLNKTDNVLDSIYEISRVIRLYKPIETFPVYSEIVDVIYLASNEIGNCFKHLININKSKIQIMKGCENLKHLEKKAEEIFYSGIFNLFDANENVTLLTKKKNILEALMKCIRQTNTVAEAIRTILLKVL